MLTTIRKGILVGLVALCTGCASTHVLVGETRPPISPGQVKLYLSPPSDYEEIALVEASSRSSWAITQQGKMNKAIERLKEEAASLGANGVLLRGSGSEAGPSVNTGTATFSGNTAYGTGVSAPVIHKAASGIAIYVPE